MVGSHALDIGRHEQGSRCLKQCEVGFALLTGLQGNPPSPPPSAYSSRILLPRASEENPPTFSRRHTLQGHFARCPSFRGSSGRYPVLRCRSLESDDEAPDASRTGHVHLLCDDRIREPYWYWIRGAVLSVKILSKRNIQEKNNFKSEAWRATERTTDQCHHVSI